MAWVHLTVRRNELYREVWEEPVQAVARRYRMSGTALKKVCRKLYVPTPPNGYWAKKAAGQPVIRPELPKLARGAPDHHRVSFSETEWDEASFSPEARAAIEHEQTVGAEIAVADVLTNPHALVAGAARLLKRVGLQARAQVLATTKCLDIVVSPAQLDRALRIMDALIKGLEARGYEVEVTDAVAPKPPRAVHLYESHLYKPSRTGVHVGEAFIEFTLEERLDVVWPHGKPPPSGEFEAWMKWKGSRSGPDYEHRPSGRLGLKLTSYTFLDPPRQSWRDGKTQRVENMLNEFVAAIADLAERHRLWAELSAREERERAEAARREEEEAARREIERRRRIDLRRRTARWSRARDVEELLATFERVHGADGHDSWLRWARSEAERLRAAALAPPSPVTGDNTDEPRDSKPAV
jgi:hypothetical protein